MRATIQRAAGGKRPWSLIWLAYLGIYFIPWFEHRPSVRNVMASLVGIAAFLIVYLDAVSARRRSVTPHIVAIAAINYAVSPFGGVFGVLHVYACTVAAARQPRRVAVATLVILQAAMISFVYAFHLAPLAWVPGVFFGVMAAAGTLLHTDLERRNRRLVDAQDEVRTLSAVAERERIARDLHDLLGHTLTLVAVKADLATRLVDRDPSAARHEMQDVADVARGALAEVRAAVTGMNGSTLGAELDRAQRMLIAADVAVEVRADARPIEASRDAVLAMALREAVTNVIRHAGATRCAITLEDLANGDLRLSVRDNGRGGAIEEGSGLSGMRARLAAAGGMLRLETGPGGATLIAALGVRPA